MSEPRKFYKTVITVTVLSEDEPVSTDCELGTIVYQITDGNWSGEVENDGGTELTPAQAAQELIAQGSDPSFFKLDENGKPFDEMKAEG